MTRRMIPYEPPESVWSESGTGIDRFGYTSMVGVSDESDTIPPAAATGAYSTGRRGIAYPPGVRR